MIHTSHSHSRKNHLHTRDSCSHSPSYILQHTATHCNTLQHTATHCNTLHHTFIYTQNKSLSHFTFTSHIPIFTFTICIHIPIFTYTIHIQMFKFTIQIRIVPSNSLPPHICMCVCAFVSVGACLRERGRESMYSCTLVQLWYTVGWLR